ncbi:glycosyltransferase family 4 protein [Sphingomonas sp. ERG5]|uniref:glycosyltransferase family 4 protein n=1 Tax=Sphingomonas sp. ERG5 TaxID=1381597 RepID=UPI00068C717A|nr:glycosyltransferase family 4 protein [Sphingomonas sp. ERG5]
MTSAAPKGAHILMLLSDAYGGFGGISQYNRDFLEALCSLPEVASVEALPRTAEQPLGALPAGLYFNLDSVGSAAKFSGIALGRGLFGPRPDIVVCGHINLLPFAALVARIRGARLILQIHGIDAWQPTERKIVNALTGQIDLVLSVSQVTIDRYLSWASAPRRGFGILPNTVRLDHFGIAPKAHDLVDRFGLAGKRVLMTFGRMADKERAKGFDTMLEVLPALVRRDPNIVYMLCGTGDDMARLQDKAVALGVADSAIFTGLVPEDRKADFFRLADTYVMPSSGEGFGIVFLEAMACGIPVIASSNDGGFEAVRNGAIGIAVDPNDLAAIETGVFKSLAQPHEIPTGLSYFSFTNFTNRLRETLFSQTPLGVNSELASP